MEPIPLWQDPKLEDEELEALHVYIPNKFRLVNTLEKAACAIFKDETSMNEKDAKVRTGLTCIVMDQASVFIKLKPVRKPSSHANIHCPDSESLIDILRQLYLLVQRANLLLNRLG